MYLDKLRLDGRVAFVTGGAQGIGRAAAEALKEAGAKVITGDLSGADVVLDVRDSARVAAVADAVVREHGRIDILVNNAGIARSETAAEDVADEHWLNVLDVNLNGSFWCVRAFGKHMLAAGCGAIVNVGSMSGLIVNRPQPQSYYNASKAAVHQLTKSLAAEMGCAGRPRQRGRAHLYQHADQRLRRPGRRNVQALDQFDADGSARRSA